MLPWYDGSRTRVVSGHGGEFVDQNALHEVVQRLRERAARRHQSLHGELLATIQEAMSEAVPATVAEILTAVRRLRVQSEGDAVAIVRTDRDGR